MQAQSVAPRSPARAVTDDTCNATGSQPANAAAVAPALSQPPVDRWSSLPVDVVMQVMYWTMLGSSSSDWARSFALTSKHFAQAGQSFRTGPWYQEAQSVLMHDRSLNWTRAYVQLIGYRPPILAPKDSGELNAALEFVGKGDEGMLHSLDLDHLGTPAPGTDHLSGIRNYQGTTLSLLTGVRREAGEQLVGIARALPPKVCLYIEFRYQVIRRRFEHVGVAGLVGRIAMSGRPTAFNLKWNAGLSIRFAELGAVLDVACGRGEVSVFNFGSLDDPDAMLRALSDRCLRFRELKLVMFGCDRPPAQESLAALAAALEKRRSAGQPRLTVVIDCAELRAVNSRAAPLLSLEQRAGFERAGLYVECLESEEFDDRAELKVLASVSGEPIRTLLPQPLMAGGESSSDSEGSADGVDSEDWPDSSCDDAQAGAAEPQPDQPSAPARGAQERSPPRVVKRDRCVIS